MVEISKDFLNIEKTAKKKPEALIAQCFRLIPSR